MSKPNGTSPDPDAARYYGGDGLGIPDIENPEGCARMDAAKMADPAYQPYLARLAAARKAAGLPPLPGLPTEENLS